MAKARNEHLNGLARLYDIRLQADANQAPDDPTFRDQYPDLFHFLSDNRVGQGLAIDPPLLMVCNSGGDWRLSISVSGLRMRTMVLSSTLHDGLLALDAGIRENRLKWETNTKRKVAIREVKEPKSR